MMAPRLLLGMRRAVGPALAFALVPVLLVTSILMGLRVSATSRPRTALPASLDYSRGIVPGVGGLRDAFIEKVLGSVIAPGPAGGFLTGSESVSRAREILDRPPPVVDHELTNDGFADAYPIMRVGSTARTDTREASRERGEPTECAPVGDKTVWYRLDVPVDAGLIADTFGTDHAVTLGVFTGERIDALDAVGCSTSARGNAHVPFSAKAGARYYFQVSSLSGGALTFSIRLQGVTKAFARPAPLSTIIHAATTDGRHWAYTVLRQEAGAPISSCATVLSALTSTACSMQSYALDMATGRSRLVSVTPKGLPAGGPSHAGTISAGGRYVAFTSWASDVINGDTNTCYIWTLAGQCPDIFVHDRDADEDGVFDERTRGSFKNVRVSVSDDGAQSDDWSALSFLSRDGRYVAFQSEASNLVRGDRNGMGDAFVHDRDADSDGIFDEPGARRTIRVSVPDGPDRGDPPPDALGDLIGSTDRDRLAGRKDYVPTETGNHLLGISRNGRYAVFRSRDPRMVRGDRNGVYDVFLRDIVNHRTTRVNVADDEREANKGTRLHNGFACPVSDDGRYVMFISDATNLIDGDTNDAEDLFVRDVRRGTTRRLTVTRDGHQVTEPPAPGRDVVLGGVATAASIPMWEAKIYTMSELNHAMSADGRYLFFSSSAQLVPEDDDEHRDIYVRDLRRQTLTLVSVSTSGEKANGTSNSPTPSADGAILGFASTATNLDRGAPGDAPVPGLLFGGYVRVLPRDP